MLRSGFAAGLAAYLPWGLFPLHWPLLEPAGAVEILAHRILWSMVVVAILLAATQGFRWVRDLGRRRTLLLGLAAALITVNWGGYIYGVNSGHVVETSLGYFIDPLVTVALAVTVIGETLRRPQWAAVAIAAAAVAVLTVAYGRPPWIALTLAFSFAFYGLVKKQVGVGGTQSLAIETTFLFPPALMARGVGGESIKIQDMKDEAPLEASELGLVAATDGWFTVNVRDAAWMTSEAFGDACIFEGGPVDFGQIGYTLAVLQPGQPNGMYHREDDQEDFLVLSGECLAIIEGQERPLKAWDFVHCPPGTEHIFVGAGDGPCVLFMAGARAHRGVQVYTRDETAIKHGAGVETETPHSKEAYAPYPKWQKGPPERMPI